MVATPNLEAILVADRQKNRVYCWEDELVHSSDPTRLTLDECRDLVEFVWANEGLVNPPDVTEITRSNSTVAGTGWRLELRFHKMGMKMGIVLHEIAHALDNTGFENMHGHSAEYVKIYINLLVKYMHMDRLILLHTANEAGVRVAA